MHVCKLVQKKQKIIDEIPVLVELSFYFFFQETVSWWSLTLTQISCARVKASSIQTPESNKPPSNRRWATKPFLTVLFHFNTNIYYGAECIVFTHKSHKALAWMWQDYQFILSSSRNGPFHILTFSGVIPYLKGPQSICIVSLQESLAHSHWHCWFSNS